MARDGSGTYSLPATMAVSNQTASSTTVNSIMSDVAQALTDSINKDGSKAFAANQSLGGYKITSLGAATALTDAAQLSQVQKGNVAQAATVAGTADAITLAFSPAITSLTSGMRFRWVSGGANTVTTPTINIDSLGAKTVKKNPGGAALVVGDLGASGTIHEAMYNGTDVILLNPVYPTNLASTTEVLTGTDTGKAVTADALASLWEQGADIASAGTISIGEGGYFNVTGTTTITDIDPATDKAGRSFVLKFAGALTLTHNATTLILPGGANITTAAGDTACFISEGSDAVRCVWYQKATLGAVFHVGAPGSQTVTTNVWTKMTLSSEDFDPNSVFDAATNYRFQPTVAGYYQITVITNINAGSSITSIGAAIYKNGGFYSSTNNDGYATSSGYATITDIVNLNGSTDYVEGYGRCVGSGTLTVAGGTIMSGTFLRA